MDEADRAAISQEIILKSQLQHAERDEVVAEYTGICLYCEEPMSEPGRRWCDAQCRDGWALENKL